MCGEDYESKRQPNRQLPRILFFSATGWTECGLMFEQILNHPSLKHRKAQSFDEPLEDWYLEGLSILDQSERARSLRAEMLQTVCLQAGFYFELLFLPFWGWVFLKHAQCDSSPYPYWHLSLLMIFVIHLIRPFERVSIVRLESCLELAMLTQRKGATPLPTASQPPQADTTNPGLSGQVH